MYFIILFLWTQWNIRKFYSRNRAENHRFKIAIFTIISEFPSIQGGEIGEAGPVRNSTRTDRNSRVITSFASKTFLYIHAYTGWPCWNCILNGDVSKSASSLVLPMKDHQRRLPHDGHNWNNVTNELQDFAFRNSKMGFAKVKGLLEHRTGEHLRRTLCVLPLFWHWSDMNVIHYPVLWSTETYV